MKNLVFAAIAIAVALLIYTQVNKTDETVAATSEPMQTKSPAVETPAAETPATPAPMEMPAELISSAPDNAAVFIAEPGDGTTVSSPVTVKFGITNMTVAPAGDNTHHSGHHHILVDQQTLPDMTQPIPATDEIIHFGLGQTETILELEPGEHTLQLVLGNYLHIPHDPPVMSKKITITVE